MVRRPRGLTLLELMVAISLMAILLALGAVQYRRMQANNAFLNEVQRFAAELKNLGTLARAAGDLDPSFVSKGTNTNLASRSGRFRWETYQDGQVRQTGELGTQGTVTCTFSTSYGSPGAAKTGAIKGAWMDLCLVGPQGSVQERFARVAMRPDGSPLDPGTFELKHLDQTLTLKLTTMGAVEGPK